MTRYFCVTVSPLGDDIAAPSAGEPPETGGRERRWRMTDRRQTRLDGPMIADITPDWSLQQEAREKVQGVMEELSLSSTSATGMTFQRFTHRDQLYVTGAPNVSIKKPLNGLLGELFLASWRDPKRCSATKLVVEQVSHHPPITAMHISSKEHGIRADGYARVKMSFPGNVDIRQFGHAVIHIDRYDEDYLVSLPNVTIRGFLPACLYPELLGTYIINSSSGYVSEINLSGTGIFQSKRNNFEARVYHMDNPEKSCYELSGVWSEGWNIIDSRTGELLQTYDVDAVENAPAQRYKQTPSWVALQPKHAPKAVRYASYPERPFNNMGCTSQ
ncbi:hypothetical protein DER46DRAFT_670913 [Fusarium sp. MPI-SDFR-AT-0072]|nr:hypothetical protein DER46DRAFT_670913 [Fusarium sp. MPI-SDFR-AT-0072]